MSSAQINLNIATGTAPGAVPAITEGAMLVGVRGTDGVVRPDWNVGASGPVGAGTEVGQSWTWDGNIWIPGRDRIRPAIDLTGVVPGDAAVQAALNSRQGGWVEIPDGKPRFNGPVTVPRGCALTGRPSGMSFGHKQFNQIPNVGTCVNVRHTGKAIIPQEQSTVEGLCFYYPDQVTTLPSGSPVDYDYTFYVANGAYGVSLLNNTIMNAYRGVFISANGGLIDTMQGAPLLRGIDVGRCADIIRVNNVQFNAGGSAGTGDSSVVAWARANLTSFSVDGADGAFFDSCFSYGANIGIDFRDVDGDNPNHPSVVTWTGGGIDTATNAIRIPSDGSLWKLLMSDVFLIGITSDVIQFSESVSGAFKPTILMKGLSSFNSSTGAIVKWVSASYGRFVLFGGELSGYSGYALQSASANAIGRLNGVGTATTSRIDPAALGDFQDFGGWLS